MKKLLRGVKIVIIIHILLFTSHFMFHTHTSLSTLLMTDSQENLSSHPLLVLRLLHLVNDWLHVPGSLLFSASSSTQWKKKAIKSDNFLTFSGTISCLIVLFFQAIMEPHYQIVFKFDCISELFLSLYYSSQCLSSVSFFLLITLQIRLSRIDAQHAKFFIYFGNLES